MAKQQGKQTKQTDPGLHFEDSIGFQVRQTHRLLQKYLQMQIEPLGITPGAWYFLRVLWNEDGLTQRELSDRVGTMEPTTLVAIKSMVEDGLVERRRNTSDGRKLNVFLTEKGRALKDIAIPEALKVNEVAGLRLDSGEEALFLDMLGRMQASIAERIERG